MKGESNQKRNSGTGSDIKISNSRAMGIIVLIALLFVFQVVTFVLHKVQGVRRAEKVAAESSGGDGGTLAARDRFALGERFQFDPNSISADSLQLLGFTARQAQSIIKYRSKGGHFRYKEDFAKLYVVDSVVYSALEGYLLLPLRGSGTKGAGKVPVEARNGIVGTEISKNVPQQADSPGGKPGDADLSGRKQGNTDSSGRKESIYGKKVEKNRYMCNLNTADSAALVKLYGIGGYYAKKIIRYREALGGSFVDVRQLLEIDGFTQERFAGIEKNIFINSGEIKGFSILNAERKALEQHPYIGPYAARGIVTFLKVKDKKTFKGDLHLLEELVREKVITAENADKIRGYLLPL